MRLPAVLALVLVASGCTIHVVEQPASAQAWYDAPPPAGVAAPPRRSAAGPATHPASATPVAAPASPAPAPRAAAQARPTAFERVTAPPQRAPVAQAEPPPTKPSRPSTSKPVTSRPVTRSPVASHPVASKPERTGLFPFRSTRPEPRRPERSDASSALDGDEDLKRPRVPVAARR